MIILRSLLFYFLKTFWKILIKITFLHLSHKLSWIDLKLNLVLCNFYRSWFRLKMDFKGRNAFLRVNTVAIIILKAIKCTGTRRIWYQVHKLIYIYFDLYTRYQFNRPNFFILFVGRTLRLSPDKFFKWY